jgi:hypothetical protein
VTVDALAERPTALGELAKALAAFQAEVPVVPKKQTAKIETGQGRNYSYTYADLATIAPVVMPLLAKHGLAFTTLPTAGERPLLVAMLVHTSGQYVTGELPITGRTPQEIGSSLTYGRRYLLGCLTGVVTDDDDDGHLAERAARRPRKGGTGPVENDPPIAPPPAPTPIQRQRRPAGTETAKPEDGPTSAPRVKMFATMAEVLGGSDRAERLAVTRAVVGRDIESSKDLTGPEVGRILAWLEDVQAGRVAWTYDGDGGVEIVAIPEPDPLPDPMDPWS